jgi:hypothetical protein
MIMGYKNYDNSAWDRANERFENLLEKRGFVDEVCDSIYSLWVFVERLLGLDEEWIRKYAKSLWANNPFLGLSSKFSQKNKSTRIMWNPIYPTNLRSRHWVNNLLLLGTPDKFAQKIKDKRREWNEIQN